MCSTRLAWKPISMETCFQHLVFDEFTSQIKENLQEMALHLLTEEHH